MEPDDCHEKIQVHRSADRVCVTSRETGVAVAEVCRKLGISEATFYNWKKKYSGMGPIELRRLRQLEEENAHFKRIVADLTLDKQMLQDVLKKALKVRQRRQLVSMLLAEYRVSERRACATVFIQRTVSLRGLTTRRSRPCGSAFKEIADGGALRLRTHSHPATA